MDRSTRPAVRTFYPHVEGLRGVAALYVFVFHIWQTAIQHATTATLAIWFGATQALQYGHFAVAVFIVISGYCLALPLAHRPNKAFDAKTFFARRARRLMPAYVPVVFISVIPFCAVALLDGGHINPKNIVLAIALHLGLIHNLSFATTEYLNGPLWSIALECQIYVAFALLLVPVWRRFGLAAQLAVAIVLGFLPHFVLHSLDWTVPWLVALFAMGVIAADLSARPVLPKLPWTAFAAAATLIAAVVLIPFRDSVTNDFGLWPGDMAVGAAVALFFVAANRNERLILARVLASRPVVFLGTFSYSLYLIHAPLVDLVGALLHRAHAGVALSAGIWAATIVVVVAAAYAFSRVFERPFMTAQFTREADWQLEQPAAPAGLELPVPTVVRRAS